MHCCCRDNQFWEYIIFTLGIPCISHLIRIKAFFSFNVALEQKTTAGVCKSLSTLRILGYEIIIVVKGVVNVFPKKITTNR